MQKEVRAMLSIEACEADLIHLLNQAAEGKQVLTRHGVPIAHLLLIAGQPALDRYAAIARLRELSQGSTLKGMSVKKMIAKGRK